MRRTVERWIRCVRASDQQLRDINHGIATIIRGIEDMSQALDDLTAQVTRNTSVSDSVVTLVRGLAQQIRDSADDPAKIRALSAELTASTDKLGTAVTENTPPE